MIKYPMVCVHWLDSASRDPSGWTRVDQLTPVKDEILDCLTVGFLIGKSKGSIRVALNISDDDHPLIALDMIVIPRCSVVKMEYLTVKSG